MSRKSARFLIVVALGACFLTSLAVLEVKMLADHPIGPHIDDDPDHLPINGQPPLDLGLLNEGVRQPLTAPADAAAVPDDAAVVGVEVAGKYRAYLLEGMAKPEFHIVNDLLGEVPVSIAYCDLNDCVTAYTDTHGPLELGLVGLQGRHMVLKVGKEVYFQQGWQPSDKHSPPVFVPYAKYPFERTTWKEWREAHPATDIYLGSWRPPALRKSDPAP
jgi:hypothetical protein